ncbi:MAG: hypothetical protein CML16_12880 [Pusillimonas sp.]|nr:hypothetical protein [Pusillimonas sp.]HCN71860.1 hypothetical protein [Pusillimonas sp.]HCP77905.1 hypothetical protein [Pusillimonas sp.]
MFCIAQLSSDQNFMETLLSPNKFVEKQKRRNWQQSSFIVQLNFYRVGGLQQRHKKSRLRGFFGTRGVSQRVLAVRWKPAN